MRKLLMLLVRGYQRTVSPFTRPSCRFQPTCSNYAMDALEKHGALKGAWLTLKRLVKCHPLNAGGWDPVPDPITGKKAPLYEPGESPEEETAGTSSDTHNRTVDKRDAE